MRRFGVQHLIGAHCTGPEALVRLRTGLGLNRSTAKNGAVGQRFTNDQGIDEASARLVR